jgi:hypothetical protein
MTAKSMSISISVEALFSLSFKERKKPTFLLLSSDTLTFCWFLTNSSAQQENSLFFHHSFSPFAEF